MKCMIIVPANPDTEAGIEPAESALSEMRAYTEQLVKAGVLLVDEGLQPSARGARVSFGQGGQRMVSDGPFPEPNNLVARFSVLQVRSKEEAIAWVSRAPFPPGTEIEIRPIA